MMFNRLMSSLFKKSVSQSATSSILSEQESRLDILFHSSCLLVMLVSFCAMIFFLFIDNIFLVYKDIILFFIAFFSLILSVKNYKTLAVLLFVLGSYAIFVLVCLYVDVPDNNFPRTLHLFFLIYGIGVSLRLMNGSVWLRYGLALLCVFTYIFFASSNYYIDTPYKLSNYITSNQVRSIFSSIMGTTALASLGLLVYIQYSLKVSYDAVITDLRKAIVKSQFELYYQPQSDSKQIIGAEALIRWNHPTKGIIMPDVFIPVAEKSGLILALGSWVLGEACAQLVRWSKNEKSANLTISVNVSAHEFNQRDYVSQVIAVVERSGANPTLLKLELTEGLLVQDIDDVIRKMTMLRAHGIGISLDDFGTGYASLKYLKKMPLNQIKIDKLFVKDLLRSNADQVIALALIDLAKQMKLDIIAEGVETVEQQSFLSGIGCNKIQGYLLSPPLQINKFNKHLGII